MRPYFLVLLAALCITGAVPAVNTLSSFVSFGETLGLPANRARALASQYARAVTPSDLADVACQAALASLGATQVETQLLNESIVEENWSQACWVSPHCIVQPRSAVDVAVLLKIIGHLQAKFSVRGGGHSPNPTWSSVGSDGILVDLGRLDSVTISSDGSVASVGSGARWGDVYSALDSHGAFVIGTKDRTVGVGGSILGGGFHHLSNQFGLAADNVKNVEVVLSDGSIVHANLTQYSDLFWALKGGGPNFGIVTRYDLYTVPVHDAWVQMNVYSPADGLNLIAAFDEWQKIEATDIKSNADIIISLDYIVLILVHSEPRAEPPEVFRPFAQVQPIEVAVPPTNMTFNQLSTILATSVSGSPARHDYRAYSSRIDTNLTLEVYSLWREKAAAVRQSTGANQTFVLQHVGQNLIGKTAENGGSALSIPQGPQQWWTTTVDWESARDDDLVRSVSRETTQNWTRLARGRDLDVSFLYMNDASRDQNPLASYGPKTLARLKAVAEKYDPNKVFQTLQNGGFLLSRAYDPGSPMLAS